MCLERKGSVLLVPTEGEEVVVYACNAIAVRPQLLPLPALFLSFPLPLLVHLL